MNGVAPTVRGLAAGMAERETVHPGPAGTDGWRARTASTSRASAMGYPDLRFGFPVHGPLARHRRRARSDAVYIVPDSRPLGQQAILTRYRLDIRMTTRSKRPCELERGLAPLRACPAG
jgi:hypothetical protein